MIISRGIFLSSAIVLYELIVDIIHNSLNQLLFLSGHLPYRRSDILELTAFDDGRADSDLLHQLLDVRKVHHRRYAARDGPRICHNPVRRRGDQISARCGHGSHGDDHFFLDLQLSDGSVDLLGCRHTAPGRIDSQDDRLDAVIIGQFVYLLDTLSAIGDDSFDSDHADFCLEAVTNRHPL